MQAAPPLIAEVRGRGAVFVWLGLSAVAVAAALLYFFNPSDNGYYPQCFFRVVTGWDCPGCGGLRATHQLLHGHLREAFALNPLFIVALPLIAYFSARPLIQSLTGRRLPQPFHGTMWVWVGCSILIAFGVLRNLPWRAWFNG